MLEVIIIWGLFTTLLLIVTGILALWNRLSDGHYSADRADCVMLFYLPLVAAWCVGTMLLPLAVIWWVTEMVVA